MNESRTDDPTFLDVINNVVLGAMGSMRIIGIGVATGYNPATQAATVRSVLDFRYWDPEDEELKCYKPEPVGNCPVLHLSAGGFFSAMPVKDGDFGVILVCDRSTDEWLTTGNSSIEPVDPRRFNIQDSMFLPVGQSFATALQSTDPKNERWVFGEDGPAGFRFEVGGGQIKMGIEGLEFLEQVSTALLAASTGLIKTGSSVVETSLGPQPLSNAAGIIAEGVTIAQARGLIEVLRGLW